VALDALGVALSAGAFGVVYGLAARNGGFSLADAMAMSTLVLAGASQFAAVGLIAAGTAWPAIVLLTFLLNARHLLYAAALAPWFGGQSPLQRAVSAHVLTDETFALALSHFRRLGRFDGPGYWLAAAFVVLPWIVATAAGYLGGQLIPDPGHLALDIVFPAAMGGLAVGLIAGRRELVAAAAGLLIGVAMALVAQPSVGIVSGGLLGPLAGLLVPPDDGSTAGPRPAADLPPLADVP
jgi:4-azaleucine resistance transporter AzlC